MDWNKVDFSFLILASFTLRFYKYPSSLINVPMYSKNALEIQKKHNAS